MEAGIFQMDIALQVTQDLSAQFALRAIIHRIIRSVMLVVLRAMFEYPQAVLRFLFCQLYV